MKGIVAEGGVVMVIIAIIYNIQPVVMKLVILMS